MEKLAKRIVASLLKSFDMVVSVEEVLDWVGEQDEDELVAHSPAELAEQFYCEV